MSNDNIRSYIVHCLSETLSPMTHMMGVAGNESIINREKVMTPHGLREVPVISGNAIRHRMIREPGAMYLIGRYNLAGKLSIDQLNFLFNGGALTESSTTEDMRRIANMQQLFPLLRLLGGTLPNQIIAGSCDVMRGTLVCEENRTALSQILPGSLPEAALRPAAEFVGQYQYTRGDARRRDFFLRVEERGIVPVPAADGFVDDVPGEKSNLMIYAGQTVLTGSLFHHGFVLENVSPLEMGALLHCIERWDAKGATLGGQSRIGHGKLAVSLLLPDGCSPAELTAAYIAHVDAVREQAVDWLNDAFSVRAGRKK